MNTADGSIVIRLMGDQAPIAVKAFVDMANADFYDGLSDEDKALIQMATQEAQDYILDVAVELDAIGLQKIQESNPDYRIVRLTEEERAVFKERAKQVEAAFVERAGPRGAAILEQMKKDLEMARQ